MPHQDLPSSLEAITRTGNPARRVFHALVSIAGWIAFGWFLYHVFLQPIDEETIPTFLMLLLFSVVIVVMNMVWVWYNLRLYRLRGRRTRVRRCEFTATKDVLGRSLVGFEPAVVRAQAYLLVALAEDGRVKRYVCEDVPRDDSPALPPVPTESEG